MKPDILFWIFLTIFSITALITLLGITNVIAGIKERYLTPLFTTLILEVIGAMILLFNTFDYNTSTTVIPSEFYTAAAVDSSANIEKDIITFTVLLEKGKKYDSIILDYTQQIDALQKKCNSATLSKTNYENEFYSKITLLDQLRFSKYQKSINLDYKIESKDEVFTLLYDILISLERIQPTQNSKQEIRDGFVRFKEDHSRNGLFSHNILRQDIPLLVSEYLEKNYELEFEIRTVK